MRLELAQVVAAWPLGASLAVAALAQGLVAGRRRSTLNEALHELRRPLQALALMTPGAPAEQAVAIRSSVEIAAGALERLEREINGEEPAARRVPSPVRPLLESAVRRWQSRAALAGSSLRLGRDLAEATVEGDPVELAQAIDNLIVNAIEHGGPEVVVGARVEAESRRVRLAVLDSGRASRPGSRHESPAELIARLSGRRRRGHGLRVVRRTAAAHGGEFRLRRSSGGTAATLELPLARGQR